jgi:hypothetical protein
VNYNKLLPNVKSMLQNRDILQKILLSFLSFNIILLVVGLVIVPKTLDSTEGIVSFIAAVLMQLLIALSFIFGPLSLTKVGIDILQANVPRRKVPSA